MPDAQTQELRALLRTRKQFVRERSSHVQRLQKTLEDANIKLDGAISDIIGLSGRRMIEALIAGESDPEALAALAHRRIKAPPAALREALRGRVTDHHRFLLQLHLQHIDALDTAITAIDRGESSVTVRCVENGDERALEAEYLVLAIPLAILKRIAVTLDWPQRRAYVLENVRFGTQARVVIQSRTPFWKEARARLVPVVEIVTLPLSLAQAFGRSDDPFRDWVRLLRFLSPLTVPSSPLITMT